MKVTRKLLSSLLTLALVFTTLFVGAESTFAAESIIPEDAPVIGAEKADAEGGVMKALAEPETIAAVKINSSETPVLYTTGEYDYSNAYYVPISIPSAGNFIIQLVSKGNTNVYLADGLDANASVIDKASIPAAQTADDIYVFSPQVKEKGTYYLLFETSSYSKVQTALTIQYAGANKSGGSNTLTSGKSFFASVVGTGTRYFKITTSGTRYLTISIPWGNSKDGNYKYSVKLMDSKKKKNLLGKTVALTPSGRGYTTYAGVPKGTYYVAVSTGTDTCYEINVKATSVNENSGSTRAKAKKISKGGTKSGIITATQSSSSGDWYKLTVGASQVVNLDVTTKTGGASGGIRIYVYSGSKTKSFGNKEFYYGEPNDTLNLYTSGYGGRLAKGTYYIKVQKYGSGSGYYKLQWK